MLLNVANNWLMDVFRQKRSIRLRNIYPFTLPKYRDIYLFIFFLHLDLIFVLYVAIGTFTIKTGIMEHALQFHEVIKILPCPKKRHF